jgi:hypothetical protein
MDIIYISMARGFVYLAVGARLVQPPGAVVAAVDHDGDRVLIIIAAVARIFSA